MSDGSPTSRAEVLRRADALIELRRPAQALQALSPLLATPGDAQALCRASLALLRLGRSVEAVDVAERAITAAPSFEWGHRLRSQALLEESKSAKGQHRKHLIRMAVESSREAIRLAPNIGVVYRADVDVQLAAGDPDAAATSAARALTLEPGHAENWVVRSLVCLRSKAPRDAEAAARKAIELQPNAPAAWNNLGVALGMSGRWRDATAAYIEAARLDPTLSTAKSNLVGSGWILGRFAVVLALLPLALLPFGALVYSASLVGASLVCRAGGPLRARAERAGVRAATLVARAPVGGAALQSAIVRVMAMLTFVVVILGIMLGAVRTPVAVVTTCLILAYLNVLWLTRGRKLWRQKAWRRRPATLRCSACGSASLRMDGGICDRCGARATWTGR